MAARVDEVALFEPVALVRCGKLPANEALLVRDPATVAEVVSPATGGSTRGSS